jgi:hypothetical protein
MRWAVLILILAVAGGAASGSGFDHTVLERFDYAGLSGGEISFEPSRLCRPGFGALFLHTDPYQISSLSWDFAAARYSWRGLGFYASYRSYRLERLYNDVTASAGLAAPIYNRIYSLLLVSHRYEEYCGAGNYGRLDATLRISYNGGDFVGQAGLEEIVLKKPYEIPGGYRPEPTVRATYFASADIGLFVGFRHDTLGRGRWTFGQEVAITPGFHLRLGFTNNPNALEWGLDLSYKSLTFIFDYKAVNKLSDTVIIGLSIGN